MAEATGIEARDVRHTPRRVEKPWGYELIWAHAEEYVGKILHIAAGHALSLQYHRVKDETIHLLSGAMRLEFDRGEGRSNVLLRPGESVRIRPGMVHRMIALTDCDVLEASTPQLEDVVRLEDRYGRK
jgi:mannose-6-phosphate isomerase